MAFGMTTVLLDLHSAGLYSFDAMVLSMGLVSHCDGSVLSGVWRVLCGDARCYRPERTTSEGGLRGDVCRRDTSPGREAVAD